MKHFYKIFMICTLLLSQLFASAQLASAPARGGIKGKIRTSDGKPASYVTISIVENNRRTLSNDEGNFNFNNLKSGDYTLKTSYVGSKIQSARVTVIDGQTASVEFTLSENSAQLDEVVIGAYQTPNQKPANLGKIAIAPKDLPQSVQIIGTQLIQDQQASRLSDVLKNVNGVAYGENRGGVSGETFFARGYSLGTNNVFKNGVRANSGGTPETSTLESVEVLKGSAALLYGGVTGGAVVNMVTKKPKFEYGGEVSMRTGSYDLYKPTIDLYGPISNKLAFRTIGTYETAGSYRDNVKSKRTYINPSLLYKLSDKTELLLQGDYLKSDYTPDFGIGTLGNKIVDIGRNTYVGTNWAYNKTNTTTAQANFSHKFNERWKINAVASLQSYNRNYFSSERPAASDAGIWNRALTRSKTKEYTYNEQINLNGYVKTGSITHTLLIGADADQSRTTAYGFSNPNALGSGTTRYYDTVNLTNPSSFDIPTNFNIPQTDLLSETYTPIYRMGAFVQDLITITDKFKALTGLRYTYQKIPQTTTTTYETGAITVNETAIKKTKIETAFSPKLALIYQPIKTTSFYLSYANNFISNTGFDVSKAPLAPSIVDQYEAGVKNDFLDGKLSANLTVYRIKNSNFAQQALTLSDGTPNGDANIKELTGKTASDGVEIDLSGTIVKGLNFIAGYSYNFIRYTQTRDKQTITYDVPVSTANPTGKANLTVGGTIEGQRLVGSTKNTANATLFYTVQGGGLKGIKLGASAYYTGNRNGGYNDTKIQTASRLIPLKDFTTIDFSAGYSWKKLSLLGKVSNVTNQLNYFVHENYSINPIPPRQFVATLAYKF